MDAYEPENSPRWTSQHRQAYRALSIAADRIGKNNYDSGCYSAPGTKPSQKKTGTPWRGGYTITEAHRRVIDAMNALLEGTISPDDAMALLHYDYGIDRERFPQEKGKKR